MTSWNVNSFCFLPFCLSSDKISEIIVFFSRKRPEITGQVMFEVRDLLLGNRTLYTDLISRWGSSLIRCRNDLQLCVVNTTVHIIWLFYCLWRTFSFTWCLPDVFGSLCASGIWLELNTADLWPHVPKTIDMYRCPIRLLPHVDTILWVRAGLWHLGIFIGYCGEWRHVDHYNMADGLLLAAHRNSC